jgi:hypothetical protein
MQRAHEPRRDSSKTDLIRRRPTPCLPNDPARCYAAADLAPMLADPSAMPAVPTTAAAAAAAEPSPSPTAAIAAVSTAPPPSSSSASRADALASAATTSARPSAACPRPVLSCPPHHRTQFEPCFVELTGIPDVAGAVRQARLAARRTRRRCTPRPARVRGDRVPRGGRRPAAGPTAAAGPAAVRPHHTVPPVAQAPPLLPAPAHAPPSSQPAPPRGPDRCCSPRHRVPFNSSNEGYERVGCSGEQYLRGRTRRTQPSSSRAWAAAAAPSTAVRRCTARALESHTPSPAANSKPAHSSSGAEQHSHATQQGTHHTLHPYTHQ